MFFPRFSCCIIALLLAFGIGQAQTAAPAPSTPRLRFSADMIDAGADPCNDFYAYACSKWQARNPIPADQSSWGTFNVLHENTRVVLHDILEKYSATSAKRGSLSPVEKQIGDYYGACMNEPRIEKLGIKPLQPEFKRIAALKSKPALAAEVIRLHRMGVNVMFRFGSGQDFKDSTQQIARAGSGGLGLPDRDYYFKEDEKSKLIREQYVAHVTNVFGLLGQKPDQAAASAKAIMAIETGLAKGTLDRVSRRDPNKTYHPMAGTDLAKLTPAFAFDRYLTQIGAPNTDKMNVSEPEFFKNLNSVLDATSLDDWKTYLRWHLVVSANNYLPKRFQDENFDFFGKKLRGAKEQQARWKRCVDGVDGDLGEALGQKYVEAAFGADGKERMLKLVHALEVALNQDIQSLPWMTDVTKKRALEKLAAIDNKIGYPDQYRDYSKIVVARNDAFGNNFRANEVEFQRQLSKIGQPVDKREWGMTPPTVNAYYSSSLNNINFPAGILQPPFFDKGADDALNFGGIGVVIGHELTHGFDDQGRKFDAKGNLNDWWTADDNREFEKRAACVADQYSSYPATPDVKLNGRLTLGENAADNGGMRVAYMALHSLLAENPGKDSEAIDGLTPDQRFFLGFANIWCQNITEQTARLYAQTDPHSPGRWRVNGTVSNFPEFGQAFHCKPGSAMVPANACRVW